VWLEAVACGRLLARVCRRWRTDNDLRAPLAAAEITGRDLDLRAAGAPGLKVCRRAPIARMNGQPRTGFSDKGNPRRGGVAKPEVTPRDGSVTETTPNVTRIAPWSRHTYHDHGGALARHRSAVLDGIRRRGCDDLQAGAGGAACAGVPPPRRRTPQCAPGACEGGFRPTRASEPNPWAAVGLDKTLDFSHALDSVGGWAKNLAVLNPFARPCNC
jgi:hypothetical protein